MHYFTNGFHSRQALPRSSACPSRTPTSIARSGGTSWGVGEGQGDVVAKFHGHLLQLLMSLEADAWIDTRCSNCQLEPPDRRAAVRLGRQVPQQLC